ncbi:hypothetical protein [Halopenitus sp. POP-27]|uniref:hypothetical protein n=1 Tax=Halopenitus sp. POP-27 TaxID=2994425 RepID=UPI002468F80C|nr:hypothetical protein [Halopenitus sp. POP-27]
MDKNSLSEFKKFEKNNNVFDLKVDQIPIWERMRKGIFDEIRFESTTRNQNTSGGSIKDIKRIYMMIRNIFLKNPYLSKNYEILVYGTGRRQLESNNKWWDIYFDPLYESGLNNYIHLEPPQNASHYSPIQTDLLKYNDLIIYLSYVLMKLGLKKPSISDDVQEELVAIEKRLNHKFNVKIDLCAIVHRELHLRKIRYGFYKRLMNRIEPEILLIECSYGKETLIEVSKSLDIPVIELQHGTIHNHNLGYSYENSSKEMFPDYLFVWGEFWKRWADIPLPDERIIPTGYPYFDQKKRKLESGDSREKIIFISQETIGIELSKLALSMEKDTDIEHDIIYKLHPKEYSGWMSKYPELLESDIDVVGDSGSSIYELFSKSDIQVGVYSTALFEGIAFDLETYIYKISGWKRVERLVNEGPAQGISSLEELLTLIDQPGNGDNIGDIFKENAIDNTIEEINKVKNEGTTYRPA